MTLQESDAIILYFFNSVATIFEVSPDQVEKIKLVWKDLHEFDETHFYSFNEAMTRIQKYHIPENVVKDFPTKYGKIKKELLENMLKRERVNVYGKPYLRNKPI